MTDKSQNLTQIVLILMKSTNLSSFPNQFHFLFIKILENRFVPRELDAMTFKKPQKCGIFLFIGMSDNFYQKSFMSGISENLGTLGKSGNS